MPAGQTPPAPGVRLEHPREAVWPKAVMATALDPEALMRIVGVLVVVWLIIGLFAGLQRHYYSGAVSCAKAGTVAATIAAGPLNYVGANPTIRCNVPQPSK